MIFQGASIDGSIGIRGDDWKETTALGDDDAMIAVSMVARERLDGDGGIIIHFFSKKYDLEKVSMAGMQSLPSSPFHSPVGAEVDTGSRGNDAPPRRRSLVVDSTIVFFFVWRGIPVLRSNKTGMTRSGVGVKTSRLPASVKYVQTETRIRGCVSLVTSHRIEK